MFCPNCKAEYREGITKCADCEIELVDKLSEEDDLDYEIDPDINFIEILRTNNLVDLAFIKGILDNKGINYFIKGEIMQNIRPVDPAILMVEQSEAEKAIKLLKNVKLTYSQFSFRK
jgi:hypothetical protein